MRLAAALLIATAPSFVLAQSPLEPLGPAVDQQQIKRTDIETTQPVLVVQNDASQPAEPPPPPGIDDAGPAAGEAEAAPPATGDGETVTLKDAVPEAGEKVLPGERTAETSAPDANAPLPAKVRPTDDVAPSVTIRQDDNVTIEEYRREGAIYMVRVTPKNGPAYEYLDTDGDGRLEGDPKEGPMQPVYYTVYEWQ